MDWKGTKVRITLSDHKHEPWTYYERLDNDTFDGILRDIQNGFTIIIEEDSEEWPAS